VGEEGVGVRHFGEHACLKQRDAVEAPGCVGNFLNKLRLGGVGGLILGEEFAAMFLIGGVFLGFKDGIAGREFVAESVEGRTQFAGFGAGSSGVLGVGAVDLGAVEGGKGWGPPHFLMTRIPAWVKLE
jgi:hypothetical protein